MGTVKAMTAIWRAWKRMFWGALHAADLTVEFLEIVSVMMKAFVFYLIGVGLFCLFIIPLNVTVVLGVRTLSDLEEKIINVIVAILSIVFHQHFFQRTNPLEIMYYGTALAMVVIALMNFQHFRHKAKELQKHKSPTYRLMHRKRSLRKMRKSTTLWMKY